MASMLLYDECRQNYTVYTFSLINAPLMAISLNYQPLHATSMLIEDQGLKA